MAKIRAFIAVELDPLQKELKHIQDELAGTGDPVRNITHAPLESSFLTGHAQRAGISNGVKWVREGNIHLTILFLGYIEKERLPDVKEALLKATRDISPFELSLKGAGAFPNIERPRIIWVGVENGAEELSRIHTILSSELSGIINPVTEKRPFSPHITLGRINPIRKKLSNGVKHPCKGSGLVLKLRAMREAPFATLKVERIVLKESKLRSEGPEYSTLGYVNL